MSMLECSVPKIEYLLILVSLPLKNLMDRWCNVRVGWKYPLVCWRRLGQLVSGGDGWGDYKIFSGWWLQVQKYSLSQFKLWLIQHLPSWGGHHHRSIHGPLQNCHQSVSTNWRLQVSSWCCWSEGVYHHCHHQCYHHHHQDLVGKVLCHPICSQDEELEAIIELIRTSGNMFTDDDCEVGLIDGFCIQNILFIFCAKIFRLSTVIWSGEALLFTMLMRSVTVNRRNINVTFFPP